MNNSDRLAQLFEESCLAELQALKPGNVHIFSDGHGMTVSDFILSAKAASSVIATPEASLGERVYRAVQVTNQAVGCNTNLGIILLCAPIVQAILRSEVGDMQSRLSQVLRHSAIEDAQHVFDAIKLAKPGGLGQSVTHDVNHVAQGTLLQAMQAAKERDSIARQYSNDFLDIFTIGLESYLDAISRFNQAWAITILYLTWMSKFVDSHILRKQGEVVALNAQREAKKHLEHIQSMSNPKRYQKELLDWDSRLKRDGINPGTSADLTVATLFLAKLV